MTTSASNAPVNDDEAPASETTSVLGYLPSRGRIASRLITAIVAVYLTVGTAVAQESGSESEVCNAGFMDPLAVMFDLVFYAGPAITLLAAAGFFALSASNWGGHEQSHRYRQRAKYAGLVTGVLASPKIVIGILEMVFGSLGCIGVLL